MGRKRAMKARPTESFKDMVADQSLKKYEGFINQQVARAAQEIARQQVNALEGLYQRTLILEELLVSKFEDITEEKLANLVADKQDLSRGLEAVEEVEAGDTVRISVRTKLLGEGVATEYAESSKLMVSNLAKDGSATLGAPIEEAIVGMKVSEIKEVTVGESMVEIELNRVSRKIKEEVSNVD